METKTKDTTAIYKKIVSLEKKVTKHKKKGEIKEQILYLKDIYNLDRKYPCCLYRIAEAYYDNKEFSLAIEYCKKQLEIDKNHISAISLLTSLQAREKNIIEEKKKAQKEKEKEKEKK